MTKAMEKATSLIDVLAQGIADYAYANGYKKLALYPMGLAGFLAALGFVSGSDGIRYTTVLVLIVTLTLVILVLLLDRRVVRRVNMTKSRVLNHYVAQITESQQSNPQLFETLIWDEDVTISDNGDTIIYRWFTIRNGQTPLRALWSKCHKTIHDHDKVDRLPKPDIRAHSFVVDEHGARELGPRLLVTHQWDGPGKQIAFVHFDREVKPLEEVRFRLSWNWPGYCETLFEGNSESIDWTFRKKVHLLKVNVHFERNCRATNLTVAPLGGYGVPVKVKSPTGTVDLQYSLNDPPLDETFGFVIDVEGGGD